MGASASEQTSHLPTPNPSLGREGGSLADMAERAARLTGADNGFVFRYDGSLIHIASTYAEVAAAAFER